MNQSNASSGNFDAIFQNYEFPARHMMYQTAKTTRIGMSMYQSMKEPLVG